MIEILFISILERPVAFAGRRSYAAKRHGGLSFGVLEKGEAFGCELQALCYAPLVANINNFQQNQKDG
jgi:hypothetical protein